MSNGPSKVKQSGKTGENCLVGHPNSTYPEILHLGYLVLCIRKPWVGDCISNVLVKVVNWSLSDEKSRKVRTSGKKVVFLPFG